jgi:ArsR family transcriptional regulator
MARSGPTEDALDAAFSPELFQSLCDPTRLALLRALLRSRVPESVGVLAERCPVDVSVVSRHLRALHDAGLVSREKRGKEVFYKVEAQAFAQTLRALADLIEHGCGHAHDTTE